MANEGSGKKQQRPAEPLRKRQDWDQREKKERIQGDVPARKPGSGGDDTQGFGPRVDTDTKKGK